ncbi:MAG: DNA-binding domain-containing protein, partial [Pseudomonadota bacterium]
MTEVGAGYEKEFARAVLDPQSPVPEHLKHRSDRRFAVYRNNVYASIINVLAGRFPVVQKLVGEEFLRAMAKEYVQETPPRSAVLLHYGASFPDFIDAFPPAAAVPYLADVARLEWARHAAYHAADAKSLSGEALAMLGPRAEEAIFTLHPSLGLVRSTYPVITIWELSMRDGENEPARLQADGEDALVLRPELEVTVRKLPVGGAAFVTALSDGHPLRTAAIRTLRDAPSFDLTANL